MTPPYGASPDEWAHWDLVLGLGSDLLPVVCEPGLPISPSSQLTTYGKVPSRFDREGRVVGFPKWTQHQTTSEEIEAWSADHRLGMCVQTRRVRALDLDLTNAEMVEAVRRVIGTRLPVRTRGNSTKCLVLFEMEGEFPKQVLQTACGAIEFLANGQQAVVVGTHPSGARYAWTWGMGGIPVLTPTEFACVQSELRIRFGTGEWSEGRARKPRDPSSSGMRGDDPVVTYLRAQEPGRIRADAGDRLDVVCPWEREHTSQSDASSTSYFLAGTGGYETGTYCCLHAHCGQRTTSEFLDHIGYTLDGFDVIPDEDASLHALIGSAPSSPTGASPVAGPRFLRNPSSGVIKVLIKNVVEALRFPEWCGMFVRYDTFLNTIMIGPPESCRPVDDTDSTGLNILLSEKNFGPGAISNEMITRAMSFAAHEREYDSAIDWLRGLPEWDGVPRVEHFCARYLGAEETPYHQAVSRYWWTAHAGRVLVPSGVQADAAIILVSGQGTGKTSTTKAIAPQTAWCGELHLSTKRYDIIREMKGRVIIELAELQGLKSRDADSIKALISAMGDTFVDKYEKYAQDVVRRCVFVGSSNNDDFLSDPTGNRRFLPVYVGRHQDLASITFDRDQLWAEGTVLFETLGEVDWRDAQRLVLAEHCKFEEVDVWEEAVNEWLNDLSNWSVMLSEWPLTHSPRQYVTCGSALSGALHMDTQRQSARDMHRIVRIFVRYGLEKHHHRVSGHLTKIWIRKETNMLEPDALML